MKNKFFTSYLTLYFILVTIYFAYNATMIETDLAIDNHLYYSSVILFLFIYCLKTRIELFKYLKKSAAQIKIFYSKTLINKKQLTLIIILNIFLSKLLKFQEGLLFTNFRNSKYISQFKKGHAPPLT
ncbi:hypothetical protein [Spiroplasma sp. SV19]|uniref:hypothetical protein n=1 Tax=Spiroplasma sp. SV19 TaxID=2570468 RepID=UPI0024B7D9AA|nr:hypothetical protein [Spiroplasma sp. SV19]WHQ36739.1 hypothetical protein E7Y35_02365 [Spiroplasma sp. SV19]